MVPLPSYNYLRGPVQAAPILGRPLSASHVLRAGIRAARSSMPSPTVMAAASVNDFQGWYQEDGSSSESLLELFREKQPGEEL